MVNDVDQNGSQPMEVKTTSRSNKRHESQSETKERILLDVVDDHRFEIVMMNVELSLLLLVDAIRFVPEKRFVISNRNFPD